MGPIVWRAPTWRYMYSRSLFLLLVAVCIVDGARAEDLADNDKPGEAPGKAQAARKPKRNLSLVSNLLTDLGLSETQKAVLVGCVVALVLLTQAVNGGQSLKKHAPAWAQPATQEEPGLQVESSGARSKATPAARARPLISLYR
eukprot:CAMPEP_0172610186 /NCGR_PEP_ID=MMETSP1068-20121228/30035_1 /TAXON_ID=35684 /ORGANISM="Pseudopedinella elastica, Strain CCMP716" /LENGTH=143 /DNA_ID=CAMNT_0013413839 /DNA_START=51 /DNA_END=480 /DNA_ORIENTATION=+